MKNAHDIIIRPIITERSTTLLADGRYTFEVAKDATKPEIRRAVEELFGVKVLKVNTSRVDGKMKRMGVHSGRTASWKKAVVQIDMDPAEESYLDEGGKEKTVDRKYKTVINEFGFGQ